MSAEQNGTLFVVTGGGTKPERIAFHERLWIAKGYRSETVASDWRTEGEFEGELIKPLREKVKKVLEKGHAVNVVGTSSGGLLALCTFIEVPEIQKLVAVSPRLNTKQEEGYYPLLKIYEKYPVYEQALRWFTEHEESLTPEMRARVLVTRVRSGDKRVPPEASMLLGATNVEIPYDAKPDHYQGHLDAVTITINEPTYSQPIDIFLRGQTS